MAVCLNAGLLLGQAVVGTTRADTRLRKHTILTRQLISVDLEGGPLAPARHAQPAPANGGPLVNGARVDHANLAASAGGTVHGALAEPQHAGRAMSSLSRGGAHM